MSHWQFSNITYCTIYELDVVLQYPFTNNNPSNHWIGNFQETQRKHCQQTQTIWYEMMTNLEENKLQRIDSCPRYRSYKKAEAKPLKLHGYCLLLNPKAHFTNNTNQQGSTSLDSTLQSWKGSDKLQLHNQKDWNKLHTVRAQDLTETC